jgi:hypothetical protein
MLQSEFVDEVVLCLVEAGIVAVFEAALLLNIQLVTLRVQTTFLS